MAKKILFALMSIFLMGQSYQLLSRIDEMEITSTVVALFVAFILNLFITGIFAFIVFAFPAQRLLPSSYYHIANSSQLKQVYRILKVDWFRKALLATFWKNKDQRKKFFNGRASGIENLAIQSHRSEFGHLVPFILLNIICLYLFSLGFIWLGIFTFILNIIANLYPILLQRHHRMRIKILWSRYQRKQANNQS